MIVSGLQKLTLLDYPGKVACTVFTGGCNFRCPFCHNASLVLPQRLSQELTEEEILSFLKKRCGMLDGVEHHNAIICGDCLEVMRAMPAGSVNLVITSGPDDAHPGSRVRHQAGYQWLLS